MNQLKPFLSVLIIIAFIFSLVAIKIEIRRLGYKVWKVSLEYRKVSDHYHSEFLKYMKLTRMGRVQDLARKNLILKEAKQGQVIHMNDQLALPH